MDAAMLLDGVRAVLGGALTLAGLLVIVGGVVGVLRFPDFYTRGHAAIAAYGTGATVTLLGLCVLSNDGAVALRILLLALLTAALAPVIAHLLASAGHGGGLAPLSGRFTAPRPGVRKNGES